MTEFMMATKPAHFVRCHALLDRLGRRAATSLSMPTIMAMRDGRMVGFISTADPDKAKAACVGEMAISPDIAHPGHLIKALFDTYHAMMTRIGIQLYWVCVPDNKDWEKWIDTIQRIFPVHNREVGFVWFRIETSNYKTKKEVA
jgi:hypothetical protein